VIGLLVIGLLGCLRTFAPDLRPRGVHAGVSASSPSASCMSCHESEADALARMAEPQVDAHAHDHDHAADEPAHDHAASTAMQGHERPPLVADWMITEPRSCTDCHRVHGDRG
jgi:hypothetical protein